MATSLTQHAGCAGILYVFDETSTYNCTWQTHRADTDICLKLKRTSFNTVHCALLGTAFTGRRIISFLSELHSHIRNVGTHQKVETNCGLAAALQNSVQLYRCSWHEAADTQKPCIPLRFFLQVSDSY